MLGFEEFADALEGAVVHQDRAQERPFGLIVMWRSAKDIAGALARLGDTKWYGHEVRNSPKGFS
jgi:hypothetical protein